MAKDKEAQLLDASASHFPEHGPVDENGREILLSLKHVDINFGKGESIQPCYRKKSRYSWDIEQYPRRGIS